MSYKDIPTQILWRSIHFDALDTGPILIVNWPHSYLTSIFSHFGARMFYIFEANSIQKYLFSGGKLKHVVAGSNLIADLCSYDDEEDLIGRIWKSVSDKPAKFRRRSGGAFILEGEEAILKTIQDRFRLSMSKYLPELQFVDGVVNKLSDWYDSQNKFKNLYSHHTQSINPFIAMDTRTGRPAVTRGNPDHGDPNLDVTRQVKDRYVTTSRDSLVKKFEAPSEQDTKWPLDLKDVFEPKANLDNSQIAIIHADGNSIGNIFRKMARANISPELFLRFSQTLETATIAAAKIATEKTFEDKLTSKGYIPMRPLILGGDDITLITRAEFAIDYTKAFLEAFETETKTAFENLPQDLKNSVDLPNGLTASGQTLRLGAGPYFLEQSPKWDDFYPLAETVKRNEDIGFGALREILSLLSSDPNEADYKYRRWVKITKDRTPRIFKSLIDDAAKLLEIDDPTDDILLQALHPHHAEKVTLLPDLHLYRAVSL